MTSKSDFTYFIKYQAKSVKINLNQNIIKKKMRTNPVLYTIKKYY